MKDPAEEFALAMFVLLLIVGAIYFVLTTPMPDYEPRETVAQPMEMRD